jgi:hypothetical protein
VTRLALLIAAVILVPAAPAGAEGHSHTRAVMREFVSHEIPAPVVAIVADSCPDGSGMPCASQSERVAYIPDGTSRFSREHELGHIFDAEYMDAGERQRFETLVGLSGPWIQGTGMEGTKSPAEWFADAYAACRLHLTPGSNWTLAYGYDPSKREHRAVCGFMARAARDYGF